MKIVKMCLQSVLFLLIPVLQVMGQPGIKWQETFSESGLPEGWRLVDNDGSGTSLLFTDQINLPDGTEVTAESGQYFLTGSSGCANGAGHIDEWLISPAISVIQEADSLHFYAGSRGTHFDDSLRVFISTGGNQVSDFEHRLGYFRVKGYDDSEVWHRYSFSLSDFSDMSVRFGINYHIRDGGSGGLHSDLCWIDHFMISGDPSTINSPPAPFQLNAPPDYSYLHPQKDTTITFSWMESNDADQDPLLYTLTIMDVFPEIKIDSITGTEFTFFWPDRLNQYSAYRWTAGVTDGVSEVASPDTFVFVTPPLENMEPAAFSLCFPADGDTVSLSDSCRFAWHPAFDPNLDTLSYELRINGAGLDTTFRNLSDTVLVIHPAGILSEGGSYRWNVSVRDGVYDTSCLESWQFSTGSTTALDGSVHLASGIKLLSNFPNPFNPETVIEYVIAGKGEMDAETRTATGQPVDLSVYTVLGQKVETLVHKAQRPGRYRVVFNAGGYHLVSGIYLYRLEAANQIFQGKMLFVK